ncbi:MAG TPA: hypothetical protein VIQ62_08915 [Burkholderiales bacterium]
MSCTVTVMSILVRFCLFDRRPRAVFVPEIFPIEALALQSEA